jgi:hypothetical protein
LSEISQQLASEEFVYELESGAYSYIEDLLLDLLSIGSTLPRENLAAVAFLSVLIRGKAWLSLKGALE